MLEPVTSFTIGLKLRGDTDVDLAMIIEQGGFLLILAAIIAPTECRTFETSSADTGWWLLVY